MFNTKNQIFIIFAAFLAFYILSQTIKIIPPGQTGVIFNLKGGIQDKSLPEGLHFLVPYLQTLVQFDSRVVTYSFIKNYNSRQTIADNSLNAKTLDGQDINIELSIIVKMIVEKAPAIYQQLGVNYEQSFIRVWVSKTIQEVIASHTADALYTASARKAVTEEIYQSLSGRFKENGFDLRNILLRRINFKPEYSDAIEEKQVSFQKAQLAEIEEEIAKKDKRIAIIQGEAKAKEVEIKGRAIQANPRVAELEYIDIIEQSGRDIPVITGLKGNTFINLDKMLPAQ